MPVTRVCRTDGSTCRQPRNQPFGRCSATMRRSPEQSSGASETFETCSSVYLGGIEDLRHVMIDSRCELCTKIGDHRVWRLGDVARIAWEQVRSLLGIDLESNLHQHPLIPTRIDRIFNQLTELGHAIGAVQPRSHIQGYADLVWIELFHIPLAIKSSQRWSA